MNKTLLFILIVFASNLCFGQQWYGVINDPDGYTNVRKGPGTNYEIVAKAQDNEIFYIEDSDSDWFLIYLIENNYLEGYIHSSRVRRISELQPIGEREYKSGLLTIKDKKYEFTIARSDFKKSEHEYELQDDKWVIKIDGTSPYGVDGNYPSTQISTFKFKIDSTTVNTPKSAYSDLYENNLGATSIFKNTDGTIYITMAENSDGAGAYDAVWLFKDGQYLKRVIIVP
ncbi:SH3 domain-containing protein [Marinoscillum sp. 108]|uniref:SH3 domain-containing protein n=1 Tax=Marinoscillum sp. 108 TaxID=2653151 RepID=UPI0012F34F6A|nr:SH3 domain-containing protein [Marinoscillum sp. 108]VXD13399.1 conserved hypothetical protein [Marinoscillum sp. 108]